MKKKLPFISSLRTAAGTLLLASVATTASAELLLSDNFNYTEGNLYQQGGWLQFASSDANPIQVGGDPLSYPGYQATAEGKTAQLANVSEISQAVFSKFTKTVGEGAVYYSMLINVKTPFDNPTYNFTSLAMTPYSGDIADKKTGTEYAKIYLKKGSADGKFVFGLNRSGYSGYAQYGTTEYDTGKTYLIVVKYEVVDGSSNDIVALYVNPEGTTEPTTPELSIGDNDQQTEISRGLQALVLRQRSGEISVDAVRAATTYAELFGATPAATPTITPAKKVLSNQQAFIGETYTQTVNIKAADLKGDITVSIGGDGKSDLTASAATISKADAESAAGYDLTLTLKPTSEDYYQATVYLDSEGANQAKIDYYWSPVTVNEVPDLQTLASKEADQYTTYKYTGEAVVTFVDEATSSSSSYPSAYVQDATGGFRIYNAFDTYAKMPKAGDKISNFYVTLESSFGLYGVPVTSTTFTTVAEGQEVAPVKVTLAELAATPANYFNKLIEVENVKFTEIAGQAITADMSSPAINDGTADGRMKIFRATDIVGYTAPATAVNITGISTSASAAIIAPRSQSDITGASSGVAAIEFAETPAVTVYDLSGRVAKNIDACTSQKQLTDELPSGTYIVRARTTNGEKAIKISVIR